MIIQANAQYWLDYLTQMTEEKRISEADFHCITKALELATTTPKTWPIVLPLASALQPYMERRGYWAEWEAFLHHLAHYAHQYNDEKALVAFWVKLGNAQRLQGNHRTALTTYQKIWRKCRRTDPETLSVALSNLGDLYRLQRMFWRAKILCGKAIDLFETKGDTLRVAYTENTMGLIDLDQRDWESALQHFEHVKSLFDQLSHIEGLALVWNNLGALYNYMKVHDQAISALQLSLEYYQQIQDQACIAKAYMNLGNAYVKQGSFTQAEHNLLVAEKLFIQINDQQNLARARHNLGMVYTRLNNWKEAEHCFKRALEQWQFCEDRWNSANTLGELAEMYLICGRFSIARRTLDEEARLLESQYGAPYQALQRELNMRRDRLSLQ